MTEQTYYHWRKEFGGMEVDQLKRLKALEQENSRLKVWWPSRRGDDVFPGRNGCANQHMTSPSNGWLRICKRAGLEDLYIHDLRRSLASLQINIGKPLEVIQKTLGHESKTTTEIYARMALETVRASEERAAEDILRAKGE